MYTHMKWTWEAARPVLAARTGILRGRAPSHRSRPLSVPCICLFKDV